MSREIWCKGTRAFRSDGLSIYLSLYLCIYVSIDAFLRVKIAAFGGCRIDDNVEDTVSNMTSGQNELLRYFQSLSDNRILALKVFAILFSFIIFFLFFLA